MSKKRVRHNIIVEILKIAKDGARKTKIVYGANLNFNQAKLYLDALNDAGFLTEKDGVWRTTEKGLHVIEACEICLRLMEKVAQF